MTTSDSSPSETGKLDEQTETDLLALLNAGASHGNVEKLHLTACTICQAKIAAARFSIRALAEEQVRDFARFLATTASPKGTVQREKLQGFATEFLSRIPPEEQQ